MPTDRRGRFIQRGSRGAGWADARVGCASCPGEGDWLCGERGMRWDFTKVAEQVIVGLFIGSASQYFVLN